MSELEVRNYGGYEHVSSTMGRTRVRITCPFCGATVIAFLWSLCGSGKKCECGAKIDGYGNAGRKT